MVYKPEQPKQMNKQVSSLYASPIEMRDLFPMDVLASMHALVRSWIQVNDTAFFLSHNLNDIEMTLHMLFNEILDFYDNFEFPRSMFPLAVMYADRFVAMFGIRHDQVFNLLLISSVITMKFWCDVCRVTNRTAAQFFSYPLHEINVMEIRFLRGMDYKFSVKAAELSIFIHDNVQSYHKARFEELRSSLFGTKQQELGQEPYQNIAAAITAQNCSVQRVTKRRSSLAATAV